jgi:hypothetical protein
LPADSTYHLRFFFVDPSGLKYPGVSTRFWFPDRIPDGSVTIQSDTSGYWQLEFTDTLTSVRYGINGMIFSAEAGVREYGILIFP